MFRPTLGSYFPADMDLSKFIVLFFLGCFSEKAVFGANTQMDMAQCPEWKPLNYRPPTLISTNDVGDNRFDSVIVITDSIDNLQGNLAALKSPMESYSKVDLAYTSSPVLVVTDAVPSGRLIYAPTGPLYRDYDDVRRFADAAKKGIERALKAGSKKPLLVRPEAGPFATATMVATLGALEFLYQPLEVRQTGGDPKAEMLGVWCEDIVKGMKELNTTQTLEMGRIIARDIAGTDPEKMAPPQVEAYMREVFKGSDVEMAFISDVSLLKKDYPLLAAVNRAANAVPRHRGRLIYLEYTGSGVINTTLFLVGKGITFDTGGASIKTGSRMIGMSRDKSGAAAVAGFMKVLSILKPKHLRVVAGLPMVRNSVGEESYVVDEVITSRAGVRVLIGNTDAEGRMVMGDVLCRMKEMAQHAVNPHLISISTLTGHALRTVGESYTIALDNGPAQDKRAAQSVQAAGEKYGDPFEISTIRREDYESHTANHQFADITQIGRNRYRGHQGPAAFLIMASGLDNHGRNSSKPLPYTHLDIAGSAIMAPSSTPSGTPVLGLSGLYMLGTG